MQKAYRMMSRGVHPDHAENNKKNEMTEKFRLLGKIRDILTDTNKRRTYDKYGIVESGGKPRVYVVSDEQMLACMNNYAGIYLYKYSYFKYCTIYLSFEGKEAEKQSIRAQYIKSHGSINYVLRHVSFMRKEDQPRVIAVIEGTW